MLETTWQTRGGWAIVRDALLVGPWYEDAKRAVDHQRPPGDHEAEHCLLRTVGCVNGQDLEMACEPAPGYDSAEATWSYAGEGYGLAEAAIGGNGRTLRITTDLRMGFEGRRAHVETTREGDERFVALTWSDHPAPETYGDAADRMWRTQGIGGTGSTTASSPTIPGRSTCSAAPSR